MKQKYVNNVDYEEKKSGLRGDTGVMESDALKRMAGKGDNIGTEV